jgi:hypothetical protein
MPNENYSLGGAASQNKPRFFLVRAQLSTDKRNSRDEPETKLLSARSKRFCSLNKTESALILNVCILQCVQTNKQNHQAGRTMRGELKYVCSVWNGQVGSRAARSCSPGCLRPSQSWPGERFHLEDKLLSTVAQNFVCHFG